MNSLKLNVGTRLEQQLKLNQQQILRAELLQLPLLELQQKIETELNQNPMLEIVEPSESDSNDMDETVGLADTPNDDPSLPFSSEQEVVTEFEPEEVIYADKPDSEKVDDVDWERIFGNEEDNFIAPRGVYSHEDDEFKNDIQSESGWLETLYEQLHQSGLNDVQVQIGEYIIGLLNPNGLLPKEVVEIVSNDFEVAKEEVVIVLNQLKSFDPPGIFASSRQESLLLQLKRKLTLIPKNSSTKVTIEKAINLLQYHYDDILHKRFDQLMRQNKITEIELKSIFKLLRTLQINPGLGKETTDYVYPEFRVTSEPLQDHAPVKIIENEKSNKLYIYMNDFVVPELRISKTYRSMFQNKTLDKQTKQWLEQKFDSARSFVKALYQRKNTLVEVISTIVTEQFEFFFEGKSMHPLMQMQIAELTGLDNSTVSRAIKDKYVETDFGMFSLKEFFSFSISTVGGVDVATSEVKKKLAEIVENEDKRSPWSDQDLSDMLADTGYKVARRTIQKYRDQLGIPPQKLRKTL